jgi:hypothetical protein
MKNTSNSTEPRFLPDKPKVAFADIALGLTSVGSGLMLGFAMPDLIGAQTWTDTAKAALISLTAGATSYSVNKLAIDKGAPLAAINLKSAGVVSIGGIMVIGAAFWASTYAGLTLRRVDERILHSYGTQLDSYVHSRTQIAQTTARVAPALRATQNDLSSKSQCELASSCISGKGHGRRGPVARLLEDRASRAGQVATQFSDGEQKRDQIIVRLADQLAAYRQVLSSGDLAMAEKRTRLQRIASDIAQNGGMLNAVVPVQLVRAYAQELSGGGEVPGNPEATRQLSESLRNQASGIIATLPVEDAVTAVVPAFPGQAGVTDTFWHIGAFLPIALIAAAVDLVLPICIWLYVFWGLYWDKFRQSAPRDDEANPPAPRRGRKPAGGVS